MNNIFKTAIVLCLFVFSCAKPVMAQVQQQDITTIIQQKDSLFWKAYNACDVATMRQFFTGDMEFYHDKGGETKGLELFTTSMQKNLCGNDDFRLRRQAVPGSVEVFPMAKNGVVYGAIISGSHHFYINQKGKAEFLDGLAKFTHLWLLKDGVWKMSRILSYDHGPANRPSSSGK